MAPLISVVVPACNAARYIGAALTSVLSQTFDDFEVIVLDDGSTDGTGAIVDTFGDPRVRLIVRPNRGPSAARNEGLRAARGARFVAFLDADDCWDPEKLERQVALLDAHPEWVVVGCRMRYVSSTGRVLGCAGHAVTARDHERFASGELFPFPMSSFLVRGDALSSIGGFDESLRGSEDIDLLARLAACGGIGCAPIVLGSYRIHRDSAMARERKRINRQARFVRRRLAARRRGEDLTWEQFMRATPDSWSDRWQDRVEMSYRAAALWYSEGRPLKALAYGAIAALINPRYTFRRARQQHPMRDSQTVHGGAAR